MIGRYPKGLPSGRAKRLALEWGYLLGRRKRSERFEEVASRQTQAVSGWGITIQFLALNQ